MKSIVFFVVFLIFIIKLASSNMDSGFEECFNTYNGVRYIEYICTDRKSPVAKHECVKGDKTRVRVLKYHCNEQVGSLTISKDVLKSLPNLRDIDVSTLNTSHLGFPFNKFENIETFNASHNHLDGHLDLFLNRMPNLTEIDLSFNQIKKLLKNYFNVNNKLFTINVSHNLINHLESGVFSTLTNLEVLDLSYNKISSISENLFKENKILKTLDLRSNPMKSFYFKIFSPDAGVVKVYLPSNEIMILDISCDQFVCHFEDFTDDEHFENIKTFRASGNQFKNFSTILNRFGRALEVLSLTQSFIGILSNNMMEKFSDLKEFSMTRANVSNIEANAFSYQTKLTRLDLSFNELTEVDSTIFWKKFLDLAWLNLEGNRLSRIDNVIPSNLPNLQSLSISKNKFPCYYLLRFLDRWKQHDKELKLPNTTSNGKDNIKGIDCNNETQSSTRNLDYEIHGNGRRSTLNINTDNYGIVSSTKCPSTLLYIIIIITLCIIIVMFIISAIICYVCQKKDHGKVRSLVKTDIGIQTIEQNELIFEPIQTNNDSHYEEIELKSLSSSQTDTLPLEYRPLPTPPMQDRNFHSNSFISNSHLPIKDQYASVVKKQNRT